MLARAAFLTSAEPNKKRRISAETFLIHTSCCLCWYRSSTISCHYCLLISILKFSSRIMSPSADTVPNRSSTNGHVGPKFTRPKAASTILREYLADADKMIVCPGVYDGFTARMALKAGFDSLYMVRNTACPRNSKLIYVSHDKRQELERLFLDSAWLI